ncbi:flavin-containing monooxygenase [Sphingobium xenophagum]|uniref:flavin-containing monooxygenase n=2 Tax=Sphingobium TaxID=165695 RepID=UPI00241D54A6|nr:NAD(P)/FAD-dependent oxidoreductase [Sphingobium xenophagum]
MANGKIDVEALERKYREEREKRIRTDGREQYRVIDAQHSTAFLDDPFAPEMPARAARNINVEVLLVGGGFGGLLSAVRLQQAGIDDIAIIDRASDFGGTWYWNRYPGVHCDIESYIYVPLLEELGSVPSKKYAPGGEILNYAQMIGRKYGLYDKAIFQTTVNGMVWNDEAARWTVTTDRGDTIHAHFVCISPGPFPWPKLPGIEGIETFKGKAFHTCRWDYEYTGGEPGSLELDRLHDKTVGVIGTGATGLQCIPPLGRSAKHLYVFQRTPSTVGVRDNRPTDPAFLASLKPGWQRERMDNFNATISGQSVDTDMVNDCWSRALSVLNGLSGDEPETIEKRKLADFRTLDSIRARIEEVVDDPDTAEALKPWYNLMCKRPGFHDEYLPTFNRSNVTLVDTQGNGIDRITENGVVANGKEYPIDCLVYATGFEFMSQIDHRMGFDIVGRGGRKLSDLWRGGYSSLFGLHMRDFPNCFILGNAQQAITPNFTYLHMELSRHIAFLVEKARELGIRTMESKAEAEEEWVAKVMSFGPMRQRLQKDCTPSYINNEGQVTELDIRNGFYLGGATAYNKTLADWRADGSMPGLDIS